MNAKTNRHMSLTARTPDFKSNNQPIIGESNHLEWLNERKPAFNETHIDVLRSPP